jgi:hypothetical protein
MTLPEIKAWLAEVEERCEKATPNPEICRYEHGGGRSYVINEHDRILVADYYSEVDREFYYAARTDLPRALKIIQAAVDVRENVTSHHPFAELIDAIFQGKGPK